MHSGITIKGVEVITDDLDLMCRLVEGYHAALETPRLFIPDFTVTLTDFV